MRRTLAAMTAAAVMSSAGVAAAYDGHGHGRGHGKADAVRLLCTGDPSVAHPISVPVAGETAFGYYAVPRHKARGIVVFDHGYSHTAWNWRQHLSQVAARDGVIA